MRGKAMWETGKRTPDRITPAYAGKSSGEITPLSAGWDHPRLCGEKVALHLMTQLAAGSPPPMRGKAELCLSAGTRQGITPAYAGKSAAVGNALLHPQDHPRLCGEKGTALAQSEHVRGSPPPMRGKGTGAVGDRLLQGITPAYAGKSFQHMSSFIACRDHPRLCGEKRIVSANPDCVMGSPPPMRGKGTPCKYPVRAHRITPAYAGKRKHTA